MISNFFIFFFFWKFFQILILSYEIVINMFIYDTIYIINTGNYTLIFY